MKTLTANQISTLFKAGDTVATGFINKTLWISNGQASYAVPGWPKMTPQHLMAIIGKDPQKHKAADCAPLIESILAQDRQPVKVSTLRAVADGEALRLIICPPEVLCLKEQYVKRLPDGAEFKSFEHNGRRGIIAQDANGQALAVILPFKSESQRAVLEDVAIIGGLPLLKAGDEDA